MNVRSIRRAVKKVGLEIYGPGLPCGPLSHTPKDQPGKIVPLPRKCGVCGSKRLGYDRLNVVTCETCDAILSVSGRWHPSGMAAYMEPLPKAK
jgi:hypothetical protein